MAIQNRRGLYEDFDPSKMIEGELAVVKDGDPDSKDGASLYYSPTTGVVKRLSDYNQNSDIIARSWAVGPSGSTDTMGTDTNNAMYWAMFSKDWASKPPMIGANGNWWLFDPVTTEYVDSGIDASITITIQDVTMLLPTESPYITNSGTNTDPIFHLFIPRGYTGKTAYESAVEGGYPDTEAKFESDLANFQSYYETSVASATSASQSAQSASTSATNAATSESNAATSEANALASEQNASQSEQNAATSETNAATSEANALTSEQNAATSEANARQSELNAKESEDNAKDSEINSKNYYDSIGGRITFMGSIFFSEIPNNPLTGNEYVIKDSFVTDSRFENVGITCAPGSHIVFTEANKWSVVPGNSIEITYDAATKTLAFIK